MSDEHVFRCTKCTMTFDMRTKFTAHCDAKHSFECKKCRSTFDTPEVLNMHVARIHVFDCEKCGLQFDSTELLSRHFVSTHIFKCSSCSEEFETADVCAKHSHAQHNIMCPTCKKTFATPLALLVHAKTHVYRCHECKGRFDSRLELNRHRTSTHPTLIKCEICPALFKSGEDLAEHGLQHHSADQMAPTSSNDRQMKYLCPNCAEEYDSLVNLTLHISNAHFLRCKMCPGLRFTSLHEFSEHTAQAHPVVEAKSSNDDNNCPDCSKPFETPAMLVVHFTAAHFLECAVCPSALFPSEQALDEHVKSLHLSETESSNPIVKYSCPTCSTSYDSAIDLAHHVLRAHFLRCTQCSGLRFSTLQELSEHTVQTHMPVLISSTGTQTEPENFLAEKLGLDKYCTDTSDESFQSTTSQQPPLNHNLQQYESKMVQTAEYRCDNCVAVFEDEEELEVHMEHSPFHGEPALFCTECYIGPYQDQIELLKHIESKTHKTKWVLSMI